MSHVLTTSSSLPVIPSLRRDCGGGSGVAASQGPLSLQEICVLTRRAAKHKKGNSGLLKARPSSSGELPSVSSSPVTDPPTPARSRKVRPNADFAEKTLPSLRAIQVAARECFSDCFSMPGTEDTSSFEFSNGLCRQKADESSSSHVDLAAEAEGCPSLLERSGDFRELMAPRSRRAARKKPHKRKGAEFLSTNAAAQNSQSRQIWMVEEPEYMDEKINELRRGACLFREQIGKMDDAVLWETAVLYNKYAEQLRQQNKGGLRPGAEHSSVPLATGTGLSEGLQEVRNLQNQINSSQGALQQSVTAETYNACKPRLAAKSKHAATTEHPGCSLVVSDEMRKVFHRHKTAMRMNSKTTF